VKIFKWSTKHGCVKNKLKAQSQLNGTVRNSQPNNEDNRKQRKRAGIYNDGNKRNSTEIEEMPRLGWEGIERGFTRR
jgi:hypothetical protein